MADPVDSYPGQQWVPAKSELTEPIDPYSFGSGTAYMLGYDLYEKIWAEQWVKNLYWEQFGCDNDVLDNPSWSTAPTPRLDTSITQTAPPDFLTAEQRADDKKDGVQAPETEQRNSKRRKRSTFLDNPDMEGEEQRRLRHIVKNLEIFEN